MKDAPLMMADFRDSQTLVFKPTQQYIGFSKTRGILLGKRLARLINGIWYVEQGEIAKQYKDFTLNPDDVDFHPIIY